MSENEINRQSCFIVFSKLKLRLGMKIFTLITSIGVDAIALPKLAIKLELKFKENN